MENKSVTELKWGLCTSMAGGPVSIPPGGHPQRWELRLARTLWHVPPSCLNLKRLFLLVARNCCQIKLSQLFSCTMFQTASRCIHPKAHSSLLLCGSSCVDSLYLTFPHHLLVFVTKDAFIRAYRLDLVVVRGSEIIFFWRNTVVFMRLNLYLRFILSANPQVIRIIQVL